MGDLPAASGTPGARANKSKHPYLLQGPFARSRDAPGGFKAAHARRQDLPPHSILNGVSAELRAMGINKVAELVDWLKVPAHLSAETGV